MKRPNKFFTWLIITTFYFNALAPLAYCGQKQSGTDIGIPGSLATVSASFTPDSTDKTRFVIHIKDVHCDYQVQKNISRILKQLIQSDKTSLVALEGADGLVDTSIFSVIPDKTAKQDVCDQFTKNGILTGAENLAITEGSALPFTLWGVDDADLYLKNFQAFRNIKFAYQNIYFSLKKISTFITSVKTNSYPKKLFSFDQKYLNLKNINERAYFLHNYAKTHDIYTDGYSNLSTFLTLLRLEKKPIDYSSLETEKNALLKHLQETIKPEDYKQVSLLTAKFNIGSISPDEYFNTLMGFINEQNNYPVIKDFLKREALKKSIRHDLLEADLKNVKTDITHKIIEKNSGSSKDDLHAAVNLIEQTNDLVNLHEHLFNLQLTDKELASLNETGLSFHNLINELSKLGLTLGLNSEVKNLPSASELENIELATDHCKYFYRLANERSKAMVANLIDKMDTDNQSTAVLISGGFHSNEIEKELQDKQIPFVTVTPNTTNLDSSKYMNLMMDNRVDLTSPANLPLAQYISFPVLCSMLVQKSGYFRMLKKELAAGLLSYKDNSIADYRAKLSDPISQNMLDKLIVMSGIMVDNEYTTSVETIISDISPKQIADHILTYDNKKLDMEVRATQEYYYKSQSSLKILASYLFAILEISAGVNESQGSEKNLLDYIINNSMSADKSIIHTEALERLTKLDKTRKPAPKPAPTPQSEDIELKNLALQISKELAKTGLIDINDSLKSDDIIIGRKNMSGLVKGGIEDRIWFEMTVPTADGSKKLFHAKSARFGDFESLGIEAFKALGRDTYRYVNCPLQFEHYYGFHVTEHVGDISSDELDLASDNILDYAYHLGEAVAESHLLGLIDRHSGNMRIVLENGKPVKVVNIDLTNALTEGEIHLSFQAEPILNLLRRANEAGADKQRLQEIALKFMTNFADSLTQMQRYYVNNKTFLETNKKLADTSRWKKTLTHLNPEKYSITPVINSFISIINDEFNLNLRIKYDAHEIVYSKNERISKFIQSEGFHRFNSEDDSISAKLFINRMKTLFLKTSPNIFETIQQRLPLWRARPRTIITNAISLIIRRSVSLSPVHLALYRIGDLVPPMFAFNTTDRLRVTRSDRIDKGYFQKSVKYTLKDAFTILAKQGKTEQINALLEKYFQTQLTMFRRGVLDRDPFLMQNYGIDDINSTDIKCFDFGATTSFLPLALTVPFAEHKLKLSAERLGTIVPEECVEYYEKRYKEVFNTKTIMQLWKTENGVRAQSIFIASNRPFEFTTDPAVKPHEAFHKFLKTAEFTPFTSDNLSISSDLFKSKDGSFFLKTHSSYAEKIKKRIPLWKESPITFITNIIGDILTALSPLSPNYIARTMIGDFVPAMLEFDYKTPIHITKKQAVKRGYLQKAMKYPLDKVFAELKSRNDTKQINTIIDRFFEIQTEMLKRGVFDADLFFYQNYGLDDMNSTDIKCFDFGRVYRLLPLALSACVAKRKFNRCVLHLSTMVPPECVDHYKKRYNEVFKVRNVIDLWNTETGVAAEPISISSLNENKFPDYLTGTYNSKDLVKSFMNDIGMAGHTELEKSLIEILRKAKSSEFSLSVEDLVKDEISYINLVTTIASTRTELNQKLIAFSFVAATSINNYRTSAALMVAIQKIVLDYIANMPSEKQYKLPARFDSLIEASL